MLPPGGVAGRPARADERLQPVPRPEYITRDGRDLRLDLIRGFLVFAMIVNHLRSDSPLALLTGGNRFFTSAAEGFLVISGLMTGLVYRRIIQRQGLPAGLLRLLERAATLYALTVTVTLIFSVASEAAGLPWATGVDFSDPIAFVVSVLTLHQTYYLIDVMLLYTVLFLHAPIAFVLLNRGKGWFALTLSGAVYAVYQVVPSALNLPWPIEGNHLFTFAAWQVLFFAGLALGYGQSRIPALGPRATRIGLIVSGCAMAALVALFVALEAQNRLAPGIAPALQDVRAFVDDYVFAKADLRPGRLFASAAVLSFLFFAATRFWGVLQRATGWLLLPLGQHALYAFTAHIVVAGLSGAAFPRFDPADALTPWLNAGIQILGVGLIWLLLKQRAFMPVPATRRYWHASPAIAGVVVVALLGSWPARSTLSAQVDAPAATVAVNDSAPRRYGTPTPRRPAAAPATAQASALAPPAAVAAGAESDVGAVVTSEDKASMRMSTYVSVITGTDRLTSDYLLPLSGSAHERAFYSAALGEEMQYYVYLPPNYEQSGRRYPVLYMLHGLGGHREEWIAYGLLNALDQQITDGVVPPFILVLPQGDKGYWVDNVGGGPRWGSYLTRDVVAHIDANYRTLASAASRAIGGLSMGGYAALSHAFTLPGVFGVVGAHSPSLRASGDAPELGRDDDFDVRDPVFLAAHAAGLDALRIWIDIGRGDEAWLPRARDLHDALQEREVNHVWRELPGGHDYDYWRANLGDYVRFYGSALSAR